MCPQPAPLLDCKDHAKLSLPLPIPGSWCFSSHSYQMTSLPTQTHVPTQAKVQLPQEHPAWQLGNLCLNCMKAVQKIKQTADQWHGVIKNIYCRTQPGIQNTAKILWKRLPLRKFKGKKLLWQVSEYRLLDITQVKRKYVLFFLKDQHTCISLQILSSYSDPIWFNVNRMLCYTLW